MDKLAASKDSSTAANTVQRESTVRSVNLPWSPAEETQAVGQRLPQAAWPECYGRRELSDREICSMRSTAIYSEWIDARWTMPHITVPSDHPMAAIAATDTASGPLAVILWKLRGSTCAIDTASEHLQARWEFLREEWKSGDRYASAYADYGAKLPWQFSTEEVRTAGQFLQYPAVLSAMDDASGRSTGTATYRMPTLFPPTAPTLPSPRCLEIRHLPHAVISVTTTGCRRN